MSLELIKYIESEIDRLVKIIEDIMRPTSKYIDGKSVRTLNESFITLRILAKEREILKKEKE